MTDTTPPPAARTPGQAAYEHMAAVERSRYPTRLPWEPWEQLRATMRDDWEAAVQAAIAMSDGTLNDVAVFCQNEANRLRERVAELEAANAALVLATPEITELRALLGEVLDAIDATIEGKRGISQHDADDWRQRAGLEG